MKSDYLPIDDGASDLAWRFRDSANVPDIRLSVAVRAFGEECRRAGAEAMREALIAMAKANWSEFEGIKDFESQASRIPVPSAAETEG